MPRSSRPYEVGLHERLQDPDHAVSYIRAAAEDSMEAFLLALRDYVEATQGMSKLAELSDKNRENLYRMLSEEGNPRLDSLWAVTNALKLRIVVEPIDAQDAASFGSHRQEFTSMNPAVQDFGASTLRYVYAFRDTRERIPSMNNNAALQGTANWLSSLRRQYRPILSEAIPLLRSAP